MPGTPGWGGNVSSGGYFNFEKNLSYGSGGLPIDFSSAATNLQQLSNALTGMATNGTVLLGGGSTYTLTATGCTVCVFSLPTGSFTNSAIDISAPAGATVVVNVPGASDSFSGGSINYSGGVSANDTIFNFGAATTSPPAASRFTDLSWLRSRPLQGRTAVWMGSWSRRA